MLSWSLSKYFDKWNRTTYLPLLIAFSSLSDINTTLKIGITIKWSLTLRYVIATTSLWCWKKISYNDITSISIRNRSISRCKSNKKPMSLQYRIPTGLRWDIINHKFNIRVFDFKLIYTCSWIFKNNQILKYDGCFWFHRVENANESRLCERAQTPQRLTCSQLRNAVST